MHPHNRLLLCIPLVCLVAHAQESAPADAKKYHEALLKHPHNTTVFSRFYDAWIDTQSLESLEIFLKQRAETHGSVDHIILARYQLHRGQDSNALASLNKAIESLPNDPALLLERANLLIRTLKFDDARKDLQAITNLGNEALSIEANKLIGKSYLREGNPDAAIKAWEKILTSHPKNEDLLEDLVELASSAEQTEQALLYSEKLIAASTDPYKKALRLIRRGELLAKSNQSDKAIALWSEALSQTGEGSWLEREILAFIEQSYRRLDRIDLLSAKFEELANAHPRRLVIHRELAKLEAASGNIDSAIGRFREVLRRSPGEAELREEFIRLLITSDRFDDASTEIGKMLATTPNNPELHLRLAELSFQKALLNPGIDKKISSAEILKSLENARQFLDPTEASGLRIANLMIRYGLEENGENLLKQLSTKPDATTAPAEALAAEYTRTKRKSKALETLTDLTKSSDAETVLRAANSMAPLTKPEVPFNILLSRLPDFPNNNPYIAAFLQASLAAKKPAEAIPAALKLVRSSKLSSEIQEATKLANNVITAAQKSQDIITELSKIENRSTPETCLLAALLETNKDHGKSDALFANTNDPTLLRFHSSLLSVRGDFKAAIVTLNRLAESSADNSASYFKELSDLQLRSGNTEAALKTLEKWKIAAPTDKTPWTIATRLLRESGRTKEALDTTRRALSRFSNDEDLTAILADLYQETREYSEAERIFWKLYDQAPDTTAQSRWSARLANLAYRNGKTEELKAKFIERSRSNNQSIGPILALVELARITRNEVALLEHLYQALRIKPKDIDIRLQIASAEKQAGNFDKQMAILNEGIDHDSSGRIRTSLAQAFIDQGQILKGMHMLRALNGESSSDTRFIESSANSIASSGMISEAIQYLEESLPPNPDWRARFLMAELFQKDGREAEATTILLSLMEEKDEIQGLLPNPGFQNFKQQKEDSDYYLQSLLNLVSQELYNTRNSHRSFGAQQPALPSSIDELRFRSKILLAFIANLGNPTLTEKITSAKIEDISLIADIIACHSDNGTDYLSLWEKHPTNPGLIRMIVQNGRLRNPSTGENYPKQKTLAIYDKLLETPDLDQNTRNQIILCKLQTDPKNDATWEKFFSLLETESKLPQKSNLKQLIYQLRNLVSQHRSDIPPKHFPGIKDLLLKNAAGYGISEELTIFALLGEVEPWISSMNKQIAENQKNITAQSRNQNPPTATASELLSRYGFYPQSPQIRNLPITSVNTSYLQTIASDKFDASGNSSDAAMPAKTLIKHLDRIESPVLRAWIAILAGDQKNIQKALSAKPSPIEVNDLAILKIYSDVESKRYPEACRGLIKLSGSPAYNQYQAQWAKTTFLAILMDMPEEKRTEFIPTAREIIDFYSPESVRKTKSLHDSNYASLLAVSNQLGFADLALKFTPPAITKQPPTPKNHSLSTNNGNGSTASITPSHSNPNKPKQRPASPIERFQKLVNEGKHAAAALEFFNYVDTQKKQGYNLSYIISNIKLTEEVRKEILTISDPGNNPSLSKRLNFVEICLAFKESDKALAMLRTLAAERPFDPSINLQLALCLPENEIDTAANLLKKFADSPTFYTILYSHNQRIYQARNNSTTFNYFNLLTKYLETADTEKLNYRSLSDINNQIYYFLSGSNLNNIPSLISPDSSSSKDNLDTVKHQLISRRLVTAMLRHSGFAEAGFRYTRAAKWIQDPDKIDELARNTLLIEIQQTSRNRHDSGNLSELSSSSWLSDRIKQAKSLNEIIPAEFLASIEKHDPTIATLLKSFHSIKTTKDIATFWDSGAMEYDAYQTSTSVFQNAILEKISTIPGSTDFFISRIKTISQQEILNPRSSRSGESNHIPFIRAALMSCKNQNQSTVDKLCKTIIYAIYGENFDFSFGQGNGNTYSQDYQILNRANNVIDSILNRQPLDPVTALRVFQTIDSLRVPLQSYSWIQKNFQNTQSLNAEDSIKFLDSMGFLKDTKQWQPVAYYDINHTYDQLTRSSSFTIDRLLLNHSLLQNFNYSLRTPEFINSLENRKPQTFGNLVTAAMMTNDDAQRERLMIKAFKHAAPHIAKASPKQLEDFNLLTTFLPPEAVDTLPAKLLAKVKERNSHKIAEILKKADQQFKLIDLNPSQDPFNMLDNYILQAAQYDMEKATGIFLRAHSVYKKNLAHYSNNDINVHQSYFNRILQTIASNSKYSSASTFKFYRAVINSPEGNDFGYSSRDYTRSYLHTIGSQLHSRFDSRMDNNTPNFLQPWLITHHLPKEYHNDAMAAITCYFLNQQYSTPELSELNSILEKNKDLSEKTRELIISCSHLTNHKNLTPENRAAIGQHLKKLLNEPIFSQNTRNQIALSALAINDILTIPEAAEIFSEVISKISKEDRSILASLSIDSLDFVSTNKLPDESIPHLKTISEAIWDNANSPKSGGHPPIKEEHALTLFLFAVKSGDIKNTEILLPKIRAVSVGNVNIINNLILNDQFDLADQLLPDESNSLFSSQSIYLSSPLLEKIVEFSSKSKKADQVLRLECKIISMHPMHQYAEDFRKILQERKQQLFASYLKNPPESLQVRCEILNTFHTSVGSVDPALQKEICDLASKLDPEIAVFKWFEKYSENTSEGLAEEAPYKIICSAAIANFINGDPTLFNSTCEALTKLLKQTPSNDTYKLGPFFQPFIQPALIATAQAVAENKTQSFPKILPSLKNLTIEISKQPGLPNNELSNSLAIYDFISHWENQPNNIPDILKMMSYESDQFSFPRRNFVFLENFGTINLNNNLPRYGDKPIQLATSILSRESLAPIYVTSFSWLDSMESNNLRKEVKEFTLNPPESLSLSGKVFLKYHEAVEHITSYPEKIVAYQAFLKDVPSTSHWHNLTVNSKLHLIYAMGRGDIYKHADMQAVFDSIDPKNIPQSNKDFYERTLKELKNAAAIPE